MARFTPRHPQMEDQPWTDNASLSSERLQA
jgi:hypothetical protein